MAHRTLLDILDEIKAHPRPDLLHYKDAGSYRALSSTQIVTRIHQLAAFLVAAGVEAGDRVALLSENRPEWTISDFAIQAAGAVNVPIYTTLSLDQVRHLLKDSGSRVVLVSREAHLEKIVAAAAGSELRSVVVFDPAPERDPDWRASREERSANAPRPDATSHTSGDAHPSLDQEGRAATRGSEIRGRGTSPTVAGDPGSGVEVLPLEAAYRRGEERLRTEPGLIETRRKAIGPDHLASIIYTSGTTGEPKGVMLTHRNFCSNIDACLGLIPFSRSDLALSFLPLSHVFERTVEYCYLAAGGSIAYAESMETVAANILEVRPTVLSAVPRVLEKIHARILDRARSAPAAKRRIFEWSVAAGRRRFQRQLAGKSEPLADRARMLVAERLVFGKIKTTLGGRLRFLISGGAPLRTEIAEFLLSTGIVVLEGYGLTETSPVIALNTFEHLRPGTVGRPIPGVEVRFAEDGEILVRGPNVMRGYYGKPEATHEAIQDGWFATGDIGRLDTEGFLSITDRKKDILITSGGKNVAPQPIESSLKSSRYVANAMLIGDRRPYISALIVPDFGVLETLPEVRNGKTLTPAELIGRPEVLALIGDEIQKANDRLSPFERIKRFALLERDFTPEAGEITPTMKVKRGVILEHFAPLIETLYQT